MITEDYVSFETAKLLKEKGFDGECKRVFRVLKNFGPKVYDYPEWITNKDLCELYQNCEFATIPTLQMAMKWLREAHKLHIRCDRATKYWSYTIRKLRPSSTKDLSYNVDFNTYEQACEAAIKHCLEILI